MTTEIINVKSNGTYYSKISNRPLFNNLKTKVDLRHKFATILTQNNLVTIIFQKRILIQKYMFI